MSIITRMRDGGDSGIALVTVMGIGLIGMVVATLVVAATIATAGNSGRDRLRTTEIHSAEAALDATLAEMEVSSPCSAPSFSPAIYGEGNVETVVAVTIEYFDESGVAMTACTDGVIDGIPSQAVVTATSEPTDPDAIRGVVPVRTLQSRVNLEPRFSLLPDAAIYSASTLDTGTDFDLTGAGDIWIEGGSWDCSNETSTDGSVFIPDGSVSFGGGGEGKECYIGGSLWVGGDLSVMKVRPDGELVGDSLTVKGHAGVGASQEDFSVGQDVRIGGDALVTITAGGTVRTNLGDAIKDLPDRPLPQVTADHFGADEGFTVKSAAEFKADVEAAGGSFNAGTCSLKGDFTLAEPRVAYDLTSCTEVTAQGASMELAGDVALLLSKFTVTGAGLDISSSGPDRSLWVVVPWSASATCTDKNGAYTIWADNSVSFLDSDVSSFWYTPGLLHLSTKTAFNGQVYGGCVEFEPHGGFNYENVGVPGLDLGSATTLDQGFYVELIYKREVS